MKVLDAPHAPDRVIVARHPLAGDKRPSILLLISAAPICDCRLGRMRLVQGVYWLVCYDVYWLQRRPWSRSAMGGAVWRSARSQDRYGRLVERIPIAETRNYVRCVMENLHMGRAWAPASPQSSPICTAQQKSTWTSNQLGLTRPLNRLCSQAAIRTSRRRGYAADRRHAISDIC